MAQMAPADCSRLCRLPLKISVPIEERALGEWLCQIQLAVTALGTVMVVIMEWKKY